MTLPLTPGVLVEHTAWGRGKIVGVSGPHIIVHFPSLLGTEAGPRRKLQVTAPQLRVSDVQSDSALDHVKIGRAKGGGSKKGPGPRPPTPTLHTMEQSILWFQTQFPGLFKDPVLVERELGYKRAAHKRWQELFGHGRGQRLIAKRELDQISKGLDDMYHATNIPSRFEIMAVHDGFKRPTAAAAVLAAVLGFLEDGGADRFDALAAAVGSLPAPPQGSRVLTWPNATILPFLADPSRFMVVKPQITKRMSRRMGFDILYSSAPNWHCYESVLRMSESLLQRLESLGAKDYIDVQSFIWVTKDLQ